MPNPKNIIANQISQLKDLVKEDTVNTDITAVEYNPGLVLIRACSNNLKIGNTAFSKNDLLNDFVSNNHVPTAQQPENKYATFIEMYEDARISSGNDAKYITALKIHYGLVGNKIKLLYNPVGLNRTNEPVDKEAEYEVKHSINFYEYDSREKKFKITTDQQPLKTYQTPGNIQIRRDGSNFDYFKKNVDIEAVTFSFQEIFALLYDNEKEASVAVYNATDKIGQNIKHTLILAPEGAPEPLIGLKGVYADLAHLCPPHCSSLKIKLQ